MEKVGFVGAFDKTDLLIYIAKNKIKILLYNLIIIFLQLPF